MWKRAIVWRESIYNNDFICSCGNRLAENDGTLKDELVKGDDNYAYCRKCGLPVALIRIIDTDLSGKQGSWDDYERNRRS